MNRPKTIDGTPVRIFSEAVTTNGGTFVVQTVQDRTAEKQTLDVLLAVLLGGGVVAMLAALGDWGNSKETWPVTGRVYVFGKFKKGPFSFKRVVPVELDLQMRNPLRSDR